MTREQVEALLFAPDHGQDHPTKTSKARKRLRLLYQHGYLERIPTPVGPGAWAWRPVYRLSRKGAELVASELGLPIAKLPYWGRGDDRDHRASAPKLLFLEHALKINQVRIAITIAATQAGYEIEKWLDDGQLKSQEMKDYVSLTNGAGGSVTMAVIPDAYFLLNLGQKRAHFFLELDQATMSNPRWKTRIRAYLAYVRSGKYQKRYQTTSLRVLTVTTTPKRLANLKATTVRAGGGEMFWFATWEQITSQDIFHGPIWLAGEDTPMRPLIF
jgi:hypothetical protein